jgi:tRNA (guanine37-N1)-methyltransferase
MFCLAVRGLNASGLTNEPTTNDPRLGSAMKIDILTIFPDFFRGTLDYGILRRARGTGLVEINIHDLRAFTKDKHRTVDDRPFGGGEGMVLKPEPIFECLESFGDVASREARLERSAKQSVILLSAQGHTLDQTLAAELSALDRIVLICGRYEGVDERISEHLADREVSIGDYVLSGGELGAAVIADSVTRLIPGAVGNSNSTRQESFTETLTESLAGRTEPDRDGPSSTCVSGGLLDYPHYTRPADFRGMAVPEVLVNGNHDQIRNWRRKTALAKTLRNRPDLLERVRLTAEDRELLDEIKQDRIKLDPNILRDGASPVSTKG